MNDCYANLLFYFIGHIILLFPKNSVTLYIQIGVDMVLTACLVGL